MIGDIEDVVKYRLMRAEETLGDAKILFANGKLFSVVNRIYYAMFYTVSGLLLTKGLSSSKHSGILALFNKTFVKEGIVDEDFGRFYNEMFEFRQKSDYKDLVEFDKTDVELWLNKAEKFVPKLTSLVRGIINENNRR